MTLTQYVNKLARQHNISKDQAGIMDREHILKGVILIDADWKVIKNEKSF